MPIPNGVHLITYADRLGGTLSRSAEIITASFGDDIVGITLGKAMPPNATLSVLGKLQWHWKEGERASQEARIERFLEQALSTRTDPLTVEVRAVKATPLKNRFIWFSCGHSYDVLHNFAPLSSDLLNEELRFIRHLDVVAEETYRTADRIENATQKTMVSVTKTFP